MQHPSRWFLSVAFGAVAVGLAPTTPVAQTPAPRPAFKGIWEPVSYTEDLDLTDVFFVTAQVGWAAGEAGTIIHTKDGGATWTAQLGGDPAASETRITRLRFIDEYRGWATQGKQLLQTANGQNWEQVPGAMPNGITDYAFQTPRRGVASGTSTSQGWPTEVFLTRDGGRTWTSVAQCAVRAMIDGVNRTFACNIDRFHFPTPNVGYLIGHIDCVGVGCGGPPVIGKTEDGGASWRFMVGPGDIKLARLKDVFFTDERNGFVSVHVFPSDPKIYATADGGGSWKGVIGSPGDWLRFADPEVGWGFDEHKLSYSTDGGARWSSRPHRFPANPRAVSLPRRDRGYVVGDHGMVFRYRVVPAAQATPPEVLTTAAMPGFSSALADQVGELDRLVDSLQVYVQQLPAAAGAPGTPGQPAAAGDTTAGAMTLAPFPFDSAAPLDAALPPLTGFAADCCAKRFSRLEAILGAIAGSLPQLISKNRNSNLLLAAVRMVADLPGQFRSVKGGLAAFRTASDQATAIAALGQVTGVIETLKAQANAAVQRDLPPLDLLPEITDSVGSADAAASLVAPAADALGDSTAAGSGKKRVAEAAKSGLGGLIKKKVKVKIPR
ncbi:MAG: hypothetical protein IT352_15730 [Gemmatimonadales bacterium]|nr:hypothetical protein [Gemmatimonadales bacterium]